MLMRFRDSTLVFLQEKFDRLGLSEREYEIFASKRDGKKII